MSRAELNYRSMIEALRARNDGASDNELEGLAAEAVRWARVQRSTKPPREGEASDEDELRDLLERVTLLIGREAAREWVVTPNPHLGGRPPLDLLGTAEERARLDSHLSSLEDGTFL